MTQCDPEITTNFEILTSVSSVLSTKQTFV